MSREEIKNSIDYISIIDEMNEDAFEFCKNHLYHLTSYKVLQKEDIRPVDMKEWLLPLNDNIPNSLTGGKRGALNYYLSIINQYITEGLKFVENSKADQYKDRAANLIDSVLYEKFSQDDIDDIFIIFIGLFRFHKKNITQSNKRAINDSIDLMLSGKDAELITSLGDIYKFDWGVFGRKILTAIRPDSYSKDVFTGYKKDTDKIKKFLFINNILLLGRGLQKQGFFS